MKFRTARALGVAAAAALALGLFVGFRYGMETASREALKTHEGLNATLWMQTSEEYRIAVAQAFRLADVMLDRAIADPDWTAALEQTGDYRELGKRAVILDVDETILDNAPFQGKIVLDDSQFHPENWGKWVGRAEATALPGATEFVERLRADGVDIFYVTNRTHENSAHTAKNLSELGFPVDPDGANLLSKRKQEDWGSDKSTRRAFVARSHRILLLVGDDLNDFVSGVRGADTSLSKRGEIAGAHRDKWGTKWIVIPNPAYGSWERVLYGFQDNLPRGEKLKAKYPRLKGY